MSNGIKVIGFTALSIACAYAVVFLQTFMTVMFGSKIALAIILVAACLILFFSTLKIRYFLASMVAVIFCMVTYVDFSQNNFSLWSAFFALFFLLTAIFSIDRMVNTE